MRSCRFLVFGLFAVLCGAVGCTSVQPVSLNLHNDVSRPAKSAVIFFVDGMDQDRFEHLVGQGMLPNMEKRFVRGGVRVDNAIACLPSITYANAVSLLTGRFPGHHGVLGNRWFDRRTLICRNYATAATYRSVNDDFHSPTIFEILADQFTVNVQCHTRRGALRTIDNLVFSGINWAFGTYTEVDKNVGLCIKRVGQSANRVRRWPTVLLNYFPAVDEVGHWHGSHSAEYARAVCVVDTAIGQIIDAIEEAGLADSTYFVLMTDHGHIQTGSGRTFDLVRWLGKQCHLKIRRAHISSEDYVEQFARLDPYDAVVICGADRRVVIHLRGEDGWVGLASPEVVQHVLNPHGSDAEGDAQPLHELPGVALVCTRAGPGRVNVISRRGTAVVERQGYGQDARFRLVTAPDDQQADPLEYQEFPELASFVDMGWHTSREWLAATVRTDYPDFVPQVVEMFDSPRAGDVVVFAAADWSFDATFRGGHGSCVAADMHVPMFFAGPDLAAGGRVHHARLVDIMPTVLELLGEQHRLARIDSIDGVSIASELKSATPQTP